MPRSCQCCLQSDDGKGETCAYCGEASWAWTTGPDAPDAPALTLAEPIAPTPAPASAYRKRGR